jgi:hypothetical protein
MPMYMKGEACARLCTCDRGSRAEIIRSGKSSVARARFETSLIIGVRGLAKAR